MSGEAERSHIKLESYESVVIVYKNRILGYKIHTKRHLCFNLQSFNIS